MENRRPPARQHRTLQRRKMPPDIIRRDQITSTQVIDEFLIEPVEYRRGNQVLQGEIVPQFCERTDKYNNTLRFGELGMDQLVRPVVGGFVADSPAEAGGLKVGDLLLEIDGKPVDYFSRIPEMIGNRAGKPVSITYLRDGQRGEATVVPIADKALDCAGKELTIGRLRVRPANVTEFRRDGLVSFGSCNFDEPRADLRSLGWLGVP